jgi:hypothetical protein
MRNIAVRLGVSTNTVLKVSRGPFEAANGAAREVGPKIATG